MAFSRAEARLIAPGPAPIPHLPGFYGEPAGRRAWVEQIFDDTAGDYDRMERWLSLGTGRWYRRHALRRAGLQRGMRMADVGTGTGLVAREALALVGPQGRVVGIDPCRGMLDRALAALPMEGLVGRAESLPLARAEFDFVSLGYALRHIEDLAAAFREFARILKPGGRVCILEISKPAGRTANILLRLYMTLIARLVCRTVATGPRTPQLWRYYWQTIDRCVAPAVVVDALRTAGFHDVQRSVSLGVFSEYTGVRE